MINIENKLITACKMGDRSAQEAIYRLLFSDGLKIAMRYTRDVNEAKDVLNRAFFKALTKIDGFKGDGSNFFGWVKRIIVNEALDHIKKTSFSQSFLPIEDMESHHSRDEITEHYDYENVVKLIQLLPDTSKCVFNLYVLDGYSHKEIADQLGITAENSRYHLSAARKQLKAWIFKTEKL